MIFCEKKATVIGYYAEIVRDWLMRDLGLSTKIATAVVKGDISAEEAAAIHCCLTAVAMSENVLHRLSD